MMAPGSAILEDESGVLGWMRSRQVAELRERARNIVPRGLAVFGNGLSVAGKRVFDNIQHFGKHVRLVYKVFDAR